MARVGEYFRATVRSAVIIGSAVLSFSIISNTESGDVGIVSPTRAATNFAVKCENLNGHQGSLKSLAISPIAANQLCTCGQSNREIRRRLNAAGVRCFETKISNINQPAPSNGPGAGPGPGPGPGPTVNGNNGWGNGPDGENPGSFHGRGVPRGGPGVGQTQTASKNSNPDQR